MKKRIIIIIIIILLGIIGIDMYFRFNETPDYFNLDYTIYYNEDDSYLPKLITENNYFKYYILHYDPNGYIQFSNKDKFNIIDAFNKGYIFLGDLQEKISISKEPKFSIIFNFNKDSDLTFKGSFNNLGIYYYHIDSITIKNDSESNDLSYLFNNKIISENIIIDYLKLVKDIKIQEEKNYTIYETNNYKVIKNENNIYFGDNTLSIELLTKSQKLD